LQEDGQSQPRVLHFDGQAIEGQIEVFSCNCWRGLGQTGKGGGQMKLVWDYLERTRLNLRKFHKLALGFREIVGHSTEANFVVIHLN